MIIQIYPSSCTLHRDCIDVFGPDNVGITIDDESVKLFGIPEQEVQSFISDSEHEIFYTIKGESID